MIVLATLLCAYQLSLFLILVRGAAKLSPLKTETQEHLPLPSLSIVVPARNEEKTIETGLRSLVKMDYPGLQIVVVNDRSTDGTREKSEAFQQKWPQIKIKNLTELPKGWLGKNHALHTGAQETQTELILFTDADVEMDEKFLKGAVRFFQKGSLDHLGGIPQVTSRSWYLYPLIGVFGLGFSLFTRPWQGKNVKKDRAVGIGAFNLVKRSSYEAIGGHQKLSLRPDDDLKLALVMKRSGFRTDCVNGVHGMRVEWYPDFPSLARGLEKNVMTGFEYSFFLAFLSLGVFAMTFIFPFVFPFFATGKALVVAWISVGLLLMSYLGQLYLARLPLWCVPLMPLATPIIWVIFARACLLTHLRKGVYWRDTFYSLEALRSNRMPLPGRAKLS